MDSPFRPDLFDGKTVLVTGGASGIGRAISEAFARHGADVVLVSRKEDRLREACDALGAVGKGHPSWHVADVRDAERIDAIGAELFETGGVDVLVNNAAGNFVTPFSAMSRNAWTSVIDIVLNGTANLMRSVGQRMVEAEKPGANAINIVAGYAWTGAPLLSHSGAAKAGVLNMTKSLAVEWAPHVRVNAVSPGPIEGTEGMKRLAEDLGMEKQAREAVPMQRLGHADEIGAVCLFLASPAASFVTGACLPVDGGQDSWGPFGGMFRSARGE